MDEAGARGRINAMTRPPDVKEIERKRDIRVEKEAAIKAQDSRKPPPSGQGKANEGELDGILARCARNGRERSARDGGRHDAHHLEGDRRSAPENGAERDPETARNGAELRQRVIGQEKPSRHQQSLARSRADLKDPKRPIGSFVFWGPRVSARRSWPARSRNLCLAIPMP